MKYFLIILLTTTLMSNANSGRLGGALKHLDDIPVSGAAKTPKGLMDEISTSRPVNPDMNPIPGIIGVVMCWGTWFFLTMTFKDD